MIVKINVPQATWRKIKADQRLAAAFKPALAEALAAAAFAGAQEISAQLIGGNLGLVSRNPGQGGLASAIFGELTDPQTPEAVIGVRSDSPAARYAAIHERGGTITPKRARALAVPVSDEAKRAGVGPRDPYWGNRLALIKRPGKKPVLAEPIKDRLNVHFVLVSSVHIPARHWWTTGVGLAGPVMTAVLAQVLNEKLFARRN